MRQQQRQALDVSEVLLCQGHDCPRLCTNLVCDDCDVARCDFCLEKARNGTGEVVCNHMCNDCRSMKAYTYRCMECGERQERHLCYECAVICAGCGNGLCKDHADTTMTSCHSCRDAGRYCRDCFNDGELFACAMCTTYWCQDECSKQNLKSAGAWADELQTRDDGVDEAVLERLTDMHAQGYYDQLCLDCALG